MKFCLRKRFKSVQWMKTLLWMKTPLWMLLLLTMVAVLVWTQGVLYMTIKEFRGHFVYSRRTTSSSHNHRSDLVITTNSNDKYSNNNDEENNESNDESTEAGVGRIAFPHLPCKGCCVLSIVNTAVNQADCPVDFRNNTVLEDREPVSNSSYFSPLHIEINPLMTHYFIEPTDACGSLQGSPFLIIMVPSITSHGLLRQAIRQTWANVSSSNSSSWPRTKYMPPVRVVFVFARSQIQNESHILQQENQQYGDVLYADFLDSYRNLTYKSLTSLYWAATRCPTTAFVMKVDEDTFVNVPFLVEYLFHFAPTLSRSVIGYAIPRPVCVRTGKWSVAPEAYPLPLFPRYLYGHSYVISSDILIDLVNASRFLPFVPVEDAHVTGTLAKVVGATRVHNSVFAVSQRFNSCYIVHNQKVTITKVTPEGHRQIWSELHSGHCTAPQIISVSRTKDSRNKLPGFDHHGFGLETFLKLAIHRGPKFGSRRFLKPLKDANNSFKVKDIQAS